MLEKSGEPEVVGFDPKGRPVFKNSFIPKLKNTDVSVPELVRLLFLGAVKFDNLPTSVQKAVKEEMPKTVK